MDGGASLLQRARATRHAFEDAVGVLADGRSLNDLIRPLQERRRDRQAEGLGGLEVDDKVELRRLFYGQVARLTALEDPIDVPRGSAHLVLVIRPVGYKPAFVGV